MREGYCESTERGHSKDWTEGVEGLEEMLFIYVGCLFVACGSSSLYQRS